MTVVDVVADAVRSSTPISAEQCIGSGTPGRHLALAHEEPSALSFEDEEVWIRAPRDLMRQAHRAVLNATVFLRCLSTDAQTRQLIPQVVEMIYAGELVKPKQHGRLAWTITLDEWYWVSCSLIWSSRVGLQRFKLIDEQAHHPLTGPQRVQLANHPLLSLFLFIRDEDQKEAIFFEDFFSAVWERSLHYRHIQIVDLLRLLGNYLERQSKTQQLEDLAMWRREMKRTGYSNGSARCSNKLQTESGSEATFRRRRVEHWNEGLGEADFGDM